MTPAEEREALILYNGLMEEIKIRLNAINAGTGGLLPLHPQLIKEFCCLQIRLICELVALGCLVAHGDLGISSKLKKAWHADQIMGALEGLHPDFFPQSTLQSIVPRADGKREFRHDKRIGQLDKRSFLELYNECGNTLHRGSLKKLLSQKSPMQVHYPDIMKKAQSLNDLLEIHVLALKHDPPKIMLSMLRNKDDEMRAQTIIATKGD